MIYETVKLFLEKYNLLKPKNNIIVAFSGGYDSMCLLDVMQNLAQEFDLNIIAIHLNHNWRDEESDSEEANCKKFCGDRITFYSEKLSEAVPHTETAARDARYEFFKKCAKKFNSNVILTAHNANDNAETVYYRLLKGTGITGLEGIKENREIYYRPLLNIYRADIEKYCQDNNLKPNNDSSNTNVKYARNKIRCEIFPKLKEISPDFEKHLNNLSKSAKTANKLIENQIKKLKEYSTKEFMELDLTYQSAIVHKFVREENLDYTRKKIEEILEFITNSASLKSGKKYSLTTNKWLFINNKSIKVIKNTVLNDEIIQITETGTYKTDKFKFSIEKTDAMPKNFPNDKDCKAYIEFNGEINLTLRTRKDGDVIQPLGMKGTQKLKKYLTEKEIPKHEKDTLMLLCNGNEVLWVPGYGLSDKIKVVTKPNYVIKLKKRGYYE